MRISDWSSDVCSSGSALAVHGLTTDFLSGHPRFEEVAQQLVDYVKDAEVIIHNAAFDVKFLNAELTRAGLPKFTDMCAKITDSLLSPRALHPGGRNSLDALCARYGKMGRGVEGGRVWE